MNWMGGLRKSYSKKKSLDKLKKAYSQRIVSNKLTIPKSYDTSKSQDIKSLEAYKHTFTIPKVKNKCNENEEPNIPQYHQVADMMKINYTPPTRKSSTFDSFNKDDNSYNEIPTYEYTKQSENGSEINICSFGEPYEEPPPPPPPPPLYVSTFSQAKQIYGKKKRNIFNKFINPTTDNNEIQQEYNNNNNNNNNNISIDISSFNNNHSEGSEISKYYMDYQYNKYNSNVSDEDKWIERHSINNDKFNIPIEDNNSNINNNKIFNLSIDNNNNDNNNNLLRQNISQLKSDNSFTRTSSLQYLLDYMDDIKYDRNMINEFNSYLYLLQGTKYRDEAEILYNKWNEITNNNNMEVQEVKEVEQIEKIVDDNDDDKVMIKDNKEEVETIVINNIDNNNIPIKRKLNNDNGPIEQDIVSENIKNDDINEIILRPKTSHKKIRNNKSLFLAITPSKTCLFHYHEYDQLSYIHSPIKLKSNKGELLTMRCDSINLTITKEDVMDMRVNESNKSMSCCYSTVSTNELLQSSVLYTI